MSNAFGSVGIGERPLSAPSTNQNGEFRLKLPDSPDYPRYVSPHIGYLPQEIDGRELIDKHTVLSLEPKVISIQEVIVRLTNPKRLLQEMLTREEAIIPSTRFTLPHFTEKALNVKKDS